jgi:hypothetical protein
MFRTEYEFTLPQGYLDDEGTLHRDGVMRLATAADEILPLKDPRVQKNPAYLVVVLLSRVVTGLGSLRMITTQTIENLFVADLAYLQDLYNRINHGVGEEPEPAGVGSAGEPERVGNGGPPRAGGSWGTRSH